MSEPESKQSSAPGHVVLLEHHGNADYNRESMPTGLNSGFAKLNMKENGDKSEKGYSFIQLILGIVMLVIGMKYLPSTVEDDSVAATLPVTTESDPCPNGAAYYLFVAGICISVAGLVNILSKVSQFAAEGAGDVTCCEKCGVELLRAVSGLMAIVDIVMLIWGSVVVFGAWSTWTYDISQYEADPEKYNYCAYEPMMFAFVILLIKWVLVPLMLVIFCCCGCLCAFCAFKASD